MKKIPNNMIGSIIGLVVVISVVSGLFYMTITDTFNDCVGLVDITTTDCINFKTTLLIMMGITIGSIFMLTGKAKYSYVYNE